MYLEQQLEQLSDIKEGVAEKISITKSKGCEKNNKSMCEDNKVNFIVICNECITHHSMYSNNPIGSPNWASEQKSEALWQMIYEGFVYGESVGIHKFWAKG